MNVIALAVLALGSQAPPHDMPGPVSVEVAVARKGAEDVLAISLRNTGNSPVTFEYSESPCSSTELATVAFRGTGALGFAVDRVGIIEDVTMRKQSIPPKGTYSCTFSISHWYWDRWRPEDRSKVRILWSFDPSVGGIYDKRLYGGVVKLP